MRLKAESVLDGITLGNRAPKISVTAPMTATTFALNAQPNLPVQLNQAAPISPSAATTSAPHVQVLFEYASWSHRAHTAPTTTAAIENFLAHAAARSITSPLVLSAKKMAPWLRKMASVVRPPTR